jgi:DNA-binding response OmpR family regulator
MSVFATALPVAGSADASGAEFRETPARNLVLQVEDNDCVAGLVGALLAREGLRVLRARDGAEGERLFAAHAEEIAVVMLDCRLPDIEGTVLGRRLRARAPELRVLFTSGHSYAGQRIFDDGLTGFLAKPFLPAQLTREIKSLIAEIA